LDYLCLTENLAELDHTKNTIRVTHLTQRRRLQKLSASLKSMNVISSVLTSTLDKKNLYKWKKMMIGMSKNTLEELSHLRLLMMKG
jgi:hypothetical protein